MDERKSVRTGGAVWASVAVLALAAVGCSSTPEPNTPVAEDCQEGPIDVAGRGLETGAEGVETGVETGASGIKQGVKAAGGFLADGTEGAEEGWNEQKEDTKAEAREGAEETKAASKPPCR